MKSLFVFYLAIPALALRHAFSTPAAHNHLLIRMPPERDPARPKPPRNPNTITVLNSKNMNEIQDDRHKRQAIQLNREAERRKVAMENIQFYGRHGQPLTIPEGRSAGQVPMARQDYQHRWRLAQSTNVPTYKSGRNKASVRDKAREDAAPPREMGPEFWEEWDRNFGDQGFSDMWTTEQAEGSDEEMANTNAGSALAEPGPEFRYINENPPSQPRNRHAPTSGSRPNGPPVYFTNDQDGMFNSRTGRNIWKREDLPQPGQYQKRSNVLYDIESATPGSTQQNSSGSDDSDFDTYLGMYYSVQNNISTTLIPLFDVVLNGTNSSLIYDLTWSIFSDLTGIGPKIIGPFSYGHHCFDWIEDVYLNNTHNDTHTAPPQSKNTTAIQHSNTTSILAANQTSDPLFQLMLKTHYVLIEIYEYTWSHAVALVNQTGDLDLMYGLTDMLTSMNTSSKSSSTWTAPPKSFDDSYFTQYQERMGN